MDFIDFWTAFGIMFVLAWIGICFIGGFIFDEIDEKIKKWKQRNRK